MLLGKNLVIYLANAAIILTILLLASLLAHQFALYPRLAFLSLTALLTVVAEGNLISIWFPHRVVMRGWRMQPQSAGQGCGYGLVHMGVTFVGALLLLPLAAAVVVPTYWINPCWFALTLPLALVYAAGMYALSLSLAESLLRERETAIIERLAAEE